MWEEVEGKKSTPIILWSPHPPIIKLLYQVQLIRGWNNIKSQRWPWRWKKKWRMVWAHPMSFCQLRFFGRRPEDRSMRERIAAVGWRAYARGAACVRGMGVRKLRRDKKNHPITRGFLLWAYGDGEYWFVEPFWVVKVPPDTSDIYGRTTGRTPRRGQATISGRVRVSWGWARSATFKIWGVPRGHVAEKRLLGSAYFRPQLRGLGFLRSRVSAAGIARGSWSR